MPGPRPKVLVAMSGGVDSSVAAAMLVRAGYDVVGVFMRLGSPGEALEEGLAEFDDAQIACDPKRVKIGHHGCCSINDAADARLVAAELGIPFYVCNFKKDFGRIIDYFVDEYSAGRTPNPCVRCNDWLKFGKLHEYARQIGADFVASGHYARIGNNRLLRGLDHSKDQSYVLFGVPRTQLAHMLLPIGEFEKSRVREMAREFGLPTFDKPDSQEICFVPDNDYAGLVERRNPGVSREGLLLDPAGNAVGAHAGQHRFTIGQRRGVGVALGYPVFVVGKDARSNTVTVGPREMLRTESCIVGEANWLVDEPTLEDTCGAGEGAAGWRRAMAKYRYNTDAAPARFRVIKRGGGDGSKEHAAPTPSGRTGRFEVVFDEPQEAVAAGQALVLYDAAEPDVVLGGGWITRAERVDAGIGNPHSGQTGDGIPRTS